MNKSIFSALNTIPKFALKQKIKERREADEDIDNFMYNGEIGSNIKRRILDDQFKI